MTATSSQPLIAEILEEYGEATRAALSEYLPRKEPRRHLYDLIADYPGRGGKMLRPSLCIATARAFGASLDDALRSAVSIELLHNALLIHDDIQDGSEERRGRPTLHRLAGVPMAINVGDGLALMSLRPLIENRSQLGPFLSMRILEETERMARETSEGQAMELGWRRDNAVVLDDAQYLEMVLKKTCWLLSIYPTRIGALIGTRDRVNLDGFIHFGFFLGAAFQIQDDILNLVGDAAYGKEINGDIREGKRTLMLIRLFAVATPGETDRLVMLLALDQEDRTEEDVDWIRQRMDAYGCIDYARQVAHGMAGAAQHEFKRMFGSLRDSRDLQFIRELSTWMLERRT